MACADCDDHDTTTAQGRELDELFDVLASSSRRLALHALSRSDDDHVSFDDLIEFVEDREVERPRTAVAVDLRHNHLPRLEQIGVVEFDERSGTVRYHPDERLDSWLERVAEHDLD